MIDPIVVLAWLLTLSSAALTVLGAIYTPWLLALAYAAVIASSLVAWQWMRTWPERNR